LNNTNIDFELYKVFYYVAKTLSFSEASKELYISQSAVSQSVKTLEKELGHKIFTRSTKSVSLTDEGEVLLNYVEPAIHLMLAGEKEIKESADLMEGSLSVAASDTICRYILKPYLKIFHRKYPNVRISVLNGTSVACVRFLQEGRADLAIANSPNGAFSRDTKVIDLLTFKDVFIAGKTAFPELMKMKMALADFNRYPIMMLESGSATAKYISDFFKKNGVVLTPSVELESNDLLIDLAKIGIGIACVPDFCLSKSDVELFTIKTEREIQPRSIAAVKPLKRKVKPEAENFLQILLEGNRR